MRREQTLIRVSSATRPCCAWCRGKVTPKTAIRVEDVEDVEHFFHVPVCLEAFEHFTHCAKRPRA